MTKRIVTYVLSAVFIVLLGMQFDRPAKNISNDQLNHFSLLYPVPDSVESILKVACYDCHSNNTRYPWYAEVQPIGKWINGHIQQGKKDLNFSEFLLYRPRKQFKKMEEIENLVKENEMPLPSYTFVHREANLTEIQKKLLYAWVKMTRDSMKVLFHPDSLKARKR